MWRLHFLFLWCSSTILEQKYDFRYKKVMSQAITYFIVMPPFEEEGHIVLLLSVGQFVRW